MTLSHRVVTRFSVPSAVEARRDCHADPEWLGRRLALFRRYFVPSVGQLGVPATLLCSSASAAWVADRTADLEWVDIVEENDWFTGWSGRHDEVVTRHDSDDAIHRGWLAAVEAAPSDPEVLATVEFLRLDEATGRVHRYRRRDPSPLAAFRGGLPPFAHHHTALRHRRHTCVLPGAWLLQVYHGGNISNRKPRSWRLDRRADPSVLREFGLTETESPS